MSFRSTRVFLKTLRAALKVINPPVTSQTKINSPSNIGGQDGAKMEGPRCQVLKLLHGAEVGYTNMDTIVVKTLPKEEMEDLIKD